MPFSDLHNLAKEPDFLTSKLMLITSLTFLGVSYGIILILGVVIALDTVSGVIKAVVLYGWESVSGTKFWIGILTKLGILFVPFTLAAVSIVLVTLGGADGDSTYLGQAFYNFNPIVLMVLWTLIINDGVSFLTNLISIKTKEDRRNKDLVVMLLNAVRGLLLKAAKSLLDNITKSSVCEPEDKTKDEKTS